MAETNSLTARLNQTFVKERFGTKTHVILREVRKSKVVLQFPDRADRFTMSVNEFLKFFKPVEA